MAKPDYDRYAILKNGDGSIDSMPFVTLPIRPSDKYVTWNANFDRLDKLANKYYGNPFYDFLIMYANPDFESVYDIPDGALVRVPFPLAQAKSDYEARLLHIKNQ